MAYTRQSWISHHLTPSSKTVRTDWTRALSLSHFPLIDHEAVRARQKGRMVVVTEGHINKILFPADRAFNHVLRAHLMRTEPVLSTGATLEFVKQYHG